MENWTQSHRVPFYFNADVGFGVAAARDLLRCCLFLETSWVSEEARHSLVHIRGNSKLDHRLAESLVPQLAY